MTSVTRTWVRPWALELNSLLWQSPDSLVIPLWSFHYWYTYNLSQQTNLLFIHAHILCVSRAWNPQLGLPFIQQLDFHFKPSSIKTLVKLGFSCISVWCLRHDTVSAGEPTFLLEFSSQYVLPSPQLVACRVILQKNCPLSFYLSALYFCEANFF